MQTLLVYTLNLFPPPFIVNKIQAAECRTPPLFMGIKKFPTSSPNLYPQCPTTWSIVPGLNLSYMEVLADPLTVLHLYASLVLLCLREGGPGTSRRKIL